MLFRTVLHCFHAVFMLCFVLKLINFRGREEFAKRGFTPRPLASPLTKSPPAGSANKTTLDAARQMDKQDDLEAPPSATRATADHVLGVSTDVSTGVPTEDDKLYRLFAETDLDGGGTLQVTG